MDIKLQAKILRVLQEKTFRRVGGSEDLKTDVRFVAATNQNLADYISQGKFREDLYHRISRVVVEIPSLRNRVEDIEPMSELFFERAFTMRGKKYEGMTTEAVLVMQNYTWPGNIRELLNVVERTALLWSKAGKIEAEDISIPESFSPRTPPTPPKKKYEFNEGYRPGISMNISNYSASSPTFTNLKKKWADEFEKEYLENLLARMQGNVTAAAKESGIDRSNFLRLVRRHKINVQCYREVVGEKKAA